LAVGTIDKDSLIGWSMDPLCVLTMEAIDNCFGYTRLVSTSMEDGPDVLSRVSRLVNK
jgi:hypothetical protein